MSADSSDATSSKFPVAPIIGILLIVGIYFGSQIVGGFFISVVPAFFGWSQGRINDWLSTSSFAQFYYVLIVESVTLALLFWFMRARKIAWHDIGLLKPRIMDFIVSIIAWFPYFVMNAAASVAAITVFHLDTGQRQQTGFESATTTPQLVATFISLVLLPPIVEEIVMRGFLFSSLRSGLKVIPAALLTSAIFAVAHLQLGSGAPALWLAAIDTFLLSLVLCYLRVKTGSLWAGIGLHMLKNFLAFLVLFIFTDSFLNF